MQKTEFQLKCECRVTILLQQVTSPAELFRRSWIHC